MGLPIPKLADKTFEEIVGEARALISRYAPEWTDHNLHDPGITFLDLFAWIAEMQMYYLDRVTEAQERKFLEMVGFTPLGLQAARVALSFGNVTAVKTVLAGTQLKTVIGHVEIPFETEEEIVLIPAVLTAVKTVSGSETFDRTEANEREEISYPAFGEGGPEAGATLHLGFDKPLPTGRITVTLLLFEDDLPQPGRHGDEAERVIPSVETTWEYLDGGSWQPLSGEDDGTMALTRSGRVIFDGPPSMDEAKGRFWIRCRFSSGTYEIAPIVSRILLNTVSARQVEAVVNEDIGMGNGLPDQKKMTRKHPIFVGSQVVEIRPGGGAWEVWEETEDLESSGPTARHYLFDPSTGELRFGNGLNGRLPGMTDQIRISYRTTLGSGGNIPEGRTFSIAAADFSGISVTNRAGAVGGKDVESISSAKGRARQDLGTRYRAITADDFETVALSTPGLRVARAKAIMNHNPLYPCVPNFPNWVTVVVLPVSRSSEPPPLPGEGFLDTVARHLDRHRLVTTGVAVVAPTYVKISVACTVKVKKRSSAAAVAALVEKAIMQFLDPLHGGPERKGWPFARSVYPAEVYEVVDAVEGVDYATDVAITAEGEYRETDGIIQIPPVGLVYSGRHAIGVRE
jgi:predicted phage baseplate assembly protein